METLISYTLRTIPDNMNREAVVFIDYKNQTLQTEQTILTSQELQEYSDQVIPSCCLGSILFTMLAL